MYWIFKGGGAIRLPHYVTKLFEKYFLFSNRPRYLLKLCLTYFWITNRTGYLLNCSSNYFSNHFCAHGKGIFVVDLSCPIRSPKKFVALVMLDGTYTESQLPLSLSDLHDLLAIVCHVSAIFSGLSGICSGKSLCTTSYGVFWTP